LYGQHGSAERGRDVDGIVKLVVCGEFCEAVDHALGAGAALDGPWVSPKRPKA